MFEPGFKHMLVENGMSSSELPRSRNGTCYAAFVSSKLPADVAEFFKKRMPKKIRQYFVEQGAVGGKTGGKLGGPARAAALTPERRSEIARKAAAARWAKKKG